MMSQMITRIEGPQPRSLSSLEPPRRITEVDPSSLVLLKELPLDMPLETGTLNILEIFPMNQSEMTPREEGFQTPQGLNIPTDLIIPPDV